MKARALCQLCRVLDGVHGLAVGSESATLWATVVYLGRRPL
jgi:hypothetical protein